MGEQKEKKNWLEWTVTIISGILVFFTFGFLVYQLIVEERTPPNIVIVLGEVSEKDNAFAIPVEAHNKGTATAENVLIEIVAENGESEQKAQITFSYLPGKSSSKGWVTFTKNPKVALLKTHVVGYNIP